MKYYYFSDNNQQFGPFSLDELKDKRLKKSTLVWTEGLEEWIMAEKVDELKDYTISVPPPLPNKKSIEKDNPLQIHLKSINNKIEYKKESEATFFGVLLLLTQIVLNIFGVFNFDSVSNNTQVMFLLTIILSVRIIISFWVGSISKRQNRNSNVWGWLAFFFPSISLIVIGLLEKKPLKINIDSSLPMEQQIAILMTKTNELKNDLRFNEALSVLMKIKELNYDHPTIDEEIKDCKSKIDAYNNSINSKIEVVKAEKFLYTYNTKKGKFEINQNHKSYPDIKLGEKAFLNGLQAPNGKYKLGFMLYVHIENGIVIKVSLL